MYLTSDDDTDLPCFIYIVYDNAECFSDHVMVGLVGSVARRSKLDGGHGGRWRSSGGTPTIFDYETLRRGRLLHPSDLAELHVVGEGSGWRR